MSQPAQRLIALLALAAVAALGGTIATGRLSLGGGGGDAKAAQIVDSAFGGGDKLRSGTFEMGMNLQLAGVGGAQLEGPLTAQATGAFQEQRSGGGTDSAFDATINAVGRTVRFGVTDTRSGTFVRLGGVNYTVPKAEVQRLYSRKSRPKTAEEALALLGFDPRKWLKDPKYEGSVSVNGAQTDHVSAGVDVGRLADDVSSLASKVPSGTAGTQLSGSDKRKLVSAMKDPKLDLYVGTADHIVRKLTFQTGIDSEDGRGQLSLEMTMSELNKPQRIATPAAARPFTDLEGDLRTGGLAALTGGGAAAGSAPPASSTAAPGADASAVPPDAQDYLACVRKAASAAALQGCSARLR